MRGQTEVMDADLGGLESVWESGMENLLKYCRG